VAAAAQGLLAAALLLACAAPPPTYLERTFPTANDARLAELSPGLSEAAVRQQLGEEPIANPVDPRRPFQNPHLEVRFDTGDRRRILILLYLAELATHADCPVLTLVERPAVFEDDRLVATSWGELRERLEDYGKTADWYRKLRYPGTARSCDH
jgi:hypothetical protein